MSGAPTQYSSLKEFKRGKSLRDPPAPPPPGGYKSSGWSGSNSNRGLGEEVIAASTGYVPPVSHSVSHASTPSSSQPSTPANERKGWFNRTSSTDVQPTSSHSQEKAGGGWFGRSSSPAQGQPGRTGSPAQHQHPAGSYQPPGRSTTLPNHSRDASAAKATSSHESGSRGSWLPFGQKEEKKEQKLGRGGKVSRYVPPSERTAGEQFTGRPMRNTPHHYSEEELDEYSHNNIKKPQTWGEWANEQAQWARDTANETGVAAQKQWQEATSGDTRDRVSVLCSAGN